MKSWKCSTVGELAQTSVLGGLRCPEGTGCLKRHRFSLRALRTLRLCVKPSCRSVKSSRARGVAGNAYRRSNLKA